MPTGSNLQNAIKKKRKINSVSKVMFLNINVEYLTKKTSIFFKISKTGIQLTSEKPPAPAVVGLTMGGFNGFVVSGIGMRCK